MAEITTPAQPRHHPFYRRWNDMIQRCYNKADERYPNYGGKGITVCLEWDRRNPKGWSNFKKWLIEKLMEGGWKEGDHSFIVSRRKATDGYSPETCFITNNDEACQKRNTCILTFEKVVELRRYKKLNPDTSVTLMAELFGIKHKYTLSRCLLGISWKNVDAKEAPLETLLVIKIRTKKALSNKEGLNK